MAQFLRDDGQVAEFLADDGVTVLRVASQNAQPYMPTRDPAANVAPAEPVLQFPPDDLSQSAPPSPALAVETPASAPAPTFAPPGPPPLPAGVGHDPQLVSPPPAPAPAPPAEPQADEVFPVDDLTSAAPSIQPPPASQLDKPTEVADAQIGILQDKADSVHRVGQAQVSAADEIIAGNLALETEQARIDKERATEAAARQRDEDILSEQYGRMVQRHATFKVDPNRGRSDARQAWGWIAAAISGLGSALKGEGGKNPGLDALMAGLDRNVQLQMAERDGLAQAIGMKKEAIADFRVATKNRLAEHDLRMAAELRKYAGLVDRVKVRLGSVEEKEAATQLISSLEAEATSRMGTAVAQEAAQLAAARAAAARARAAMLKAADDRKIKLAGMGLMDDPSGSGRLVRDTSVLDPLEQQGKALDVQGKALENAKRAKELAAGPASTEGSVALVKDQAGRSVNGFDGRPLMRTVKGPDGKPMQVPAMAKTQAQQEKLSDAAAAVAVVKEASQLLRTKIANAGGSIKALGSQDAQEVMALLNTIDLTNKNVEELGVIAGPDKDYLEGLRGGVDPMSFIKNAAPGLEAMERRLDSKYNAKLKQYTDYFDSDSAVRQKPADAAPAQAAAKAPHERVNSIITADPSIGDGKGAIAADAEQKLEDLKVFLSRDKPSVETVDAVLAEVRAAKMPEGTKAKLTAQIVAYRKTAEKKAEREGVTDAILPGRRMLSPLFSESARFNLPVPAKKDAK